MRLCLLAPRLAPALALRRVCWRSLARAGLRVLSCLMLISLSASLLPPITRWGGAESILQSGNLPAPVARAPFPLPSTVKLISLAYVLAVMLNGWLLPVHLCLPVLIWPRSFLSAASQWGPRAHHLQRLNQRVHAGPRAVPGIYMLAQRCAHPLSVIKLAATSCK